MRSIRLGTAEIKCHPDGVVVTQFASGQSAITPPNREDESRRSLARDLGYGFDVFMMNRENQLTHSLLAAWLGLPASPMLALKAATENVGVDNEVVRAEQEAVKAIQKFARLSDVSLIRRARYYSNMNGGGHHGG